MKDGIVVKIWNIKAGSKGRSGASQIGDSIKYITDENKCDIGMSEPSFDSEGMTDPDAGQIRRSLTYVTDHVKTLEGLYVGGRHIKNLSHAAEEMMEIKLFFGKTDGRVALHGIVSLPESESRKENAGKLMMLVDDLLSEVYPDNQAVYAVHTNTENLHCHFVLNTVGLSGKKIHMDKSFMRDVLEPALNRLAEKYGFTPNMQWEKEEEIESLSLREQRILLKEKIDLGIEENDSFAEFVIDLKKDGLTVNVGKYLSLKAPGMKKSMRSDRLGGLYTIDAIKERILTKRDPFMDLSEEPFARTAEGREIVNYVPATIKKYKDMTDKEKHEAVALLRQHKNPWKIKREANFYMEKAASELSRQAAVNEIIKTYSSGSMDIGEAKKEIIRRQREIMAEKKRITEAFGKNRLLLDLYFKAKNIEAKAYLFEAGYPEYEEEFLKYQELTDRMEDHFGKSMFEVYRFVTESDEATTYLEAQEKELSEQYKEIIRFEERKERQAALEEGFIPLFDAIGHKKAKEESKTFHVYAARSLYLKAKSGDYLRVVTIPSTRSKSGIETIVTVFTKDGEELETFSSLNGEKEFSGKILSLRNKGFSEVKTFKDKESLLKGGAEEKQNEEKVGKETMKEKKEIEQLIVRKEGDRTAERAGDLPGRGNTKG